eukprot:6210474-Pleurochrysis_carterae.AAC.1
MLRWGQRSVGLGRPLFGSCIAFTIFSPAFTACASVLILVLRCVDGQRCTVQARCVAERLLEIRPSLARVVQDNAAALQLALCLAPCCCLSQATTTSPRRRRARRCRPRALLLMRRRARPRMPARAHS